MVLRLALIGAGRRGSQHAPTIRALPALFELVAVCDVDPGRAQSLAAPTGAAAYTSVSQLLDRERLDVAVIATPPETHHLVGCAAAAHGCAMLVETPLAPTRAMMDVLMEAATRAGVAVEVGENYGRRPIERLNRAALQAGLLGPLVHVSAFNAPANDETCYHTMSLFHLYAQAEIEEVHALGHTRLESRAAEPPPSGAGPRPETWVDAAVRFSNGVRGSISYVTTWTQPARRGRQPRIVSLEGPDGYIVNEDGSGRLHRIAPSGLEEDISVEADRDDSTPTQAPATFRYGTNPPVEWSNPFAGQDLPDAEGVADGLARATELLSLYEAVVNGRPPEYSMADGRRSQEVGIAIAESARLGRPLPGQLGEETVWEQEQHERFRQRWGADPVKDVERLARGS